MYSYANGNVCSHVICHTYLILRDHEKKLCSLMKSKNTENIHCKSFDSPFNEDMLQMMMNKRLLANSLAKTFHM